MQALASTHIGTREYRLEMYRNDYFRVVSQPINPKTGKVWQASRKIGEVHTTEDAARIAYVEAARDALIANMKEAGR